METITEAEYLEAKSQQAAPEGAPVYRRKPRSSHQGAVDQEASKGGDIFVGECKTMTVKA